ncbi:MAG: rod-binding protein [Fimbriimonadaceae bacterium]
MIEALAGANKDTLTKAKLNKAAKGFETMLVKQLIETMQKGTEMFGKGPGANVYQDFFNQAIAESMANRGSIGVAKMISKQMESRLLALETAHEEMPEPSENQSPVRKNKP